MPIQQEYVEYCKQVESDYRDASGGKEMPSYVDTMRYYMQGKTPLQAAYAIYRQLSQDGMLDER